MKTGDGLKATFMALLNVMKTDTRFDVGERSGLAAAWAVLNGGGNTKKEQDMLAVQCLKKFTLQNPNY